MSEATFEAATEKAAVEKAAAELGIDAAELEHEVLEQKQDFWGGGDTTVVIKAWQRAAPVEEAPAPAQEETSPPVAEQEEPAAVETDVAAAEPEEETVEAAAKPEPADEPATTKPEPADEPATTKPEPADEPAATTEPQAERGDERPSAQTSDDGEAPEGVEPEAITKLLAQIFHDMEFSCTIEVEAEGDGYLATIAGDDKEALLEGNGRCLSALELIANNAFRHKLPRGSKVRVDAGDFRSRRDEELSDLALQVAHSAKESGRTQETQPLNPYERRLVHLALAEDAAVTTRSRGSGFLKNVQIIPQGGGDGDRGRGRRG